MSIDGRATRRALNGKFDYYSLEAAEALGLAGVSRLPCSLKVVLENVLRQHAEGRSDGSDIAAVAGWLATRRAEREIAFRFTRVLMPDSSGVPLLGDLAAMRDAMIRLGGEPKRLNPSVPVDFVIDHSVMVDAYGVADAGSRNQALELKRNARALRVPALGRAGLRQPAHRSAGQRHLHQINLEYLARVVWTADGVAVPRLACSAWIAIRAMINSLGIVGWGVGGLEGGAGALGESVAMLVPEVIGCRLVGQAAARRDLDRHRAHGDADAAPAQGGRQVRRVLRSRRRRALAPRPRHHRQHEPGERRDHGLLSGRRRDAALPAPHRPRRSAGRAGRDVLQGAGPVARCRHAAGRIHRASSRSTFRRSSRASPGRAGRTTACRSAKRLPLSETLVPKPQR